MPGVGITQVISLEDGLASLTRDDLAYFEHAIVAGRPGIFADEKDGRAEGHCTLWVALTEDHVASVWVLSLPTDPCVMALEVATAMVEHVVGR